jgi:hypothetical protein
MIVDIEMDIACSWNVTEKIEHDELKLKRKEGGIVERIINLNLRVATFQYAIIAILVATYRIIGKAHKDRPFVTN